MRGASIDGGARKYQEEASGAMYLRRVGTSVESDKLISADTHFVLSVL